MTISPTAPGAALGTAPGGFPVLDGTSAPAADFLAVIQEAMSEAAPAKAVEQLVAPLVPPLVEEGAQPVPPLVEEGAQPVPPLVEEGAQPVPPLVEEGAQRLSRDPATEPQTLPVAPALPLVGEGAPRLPRIPATDAPTRPNPLATDEPAPADPTALVSVVPPAIAALVGQYTAPAAPARAAKAEPGANTPDLAVAGTDPRTVPATAVQDREHPVPRATPATPATPAIPATPVGKAAKHAGEPATPATPATPSTPHVADPVTLPTSQTPVPVSNPATAPVAASTPVATDTTPQPAAPLDRVAAQVFPEVTGLVSRGHGTHRISLTLNPDDLGEVRVVMTVRDGSVHVRLAAGHEARAALVDGSPELARLLEHAGAGEARVVVRELPASAVAAPPGSAPTSTDTSGTPFQAGPGGERAPDQHARTRADHPATDGSDPSTPRPAGAPVQPVTGTRAAAGVDLTM